MQRLRDGPLEVEVAIPEPTEPQPQRVEYGPFTLIKDTGYQSNPEERYAYALGWCARHCHDKAFADLDREQLHLAPMDRQAADWLLVKGKISGRPV